MPDILVELHRRINALERQVSGLSRRAKAHGWTLPAIFDTHRYGGGRLIWGFDGHTVHAHAHNSIWAENNIDAGNYRATTYGGPNVEANGDDEYLSIADAAWQETGAQNFMVWGWVYPTAIHANQTVAAKWLEAGDQRSWELGWSTSKDDFEFRISLLGSEPTDVVLSTHSAVVVNRWYFVAGYFEPSVLMRIYVARNDDHELTIDSLSGGPVGSVPANTFDGTAALTIGAEDGVTDPWWGRLGRMMVRGNLPGLTIDDHVAMLWIRTRDFYDEVEPFLLRALFTAADQGYANAQVLDTALEGIFDGQLTAVEVDGTLALTSQECVFTAQGTPAWGDQGFYSQAITRALGRTLLVKITKGSVAAGLSGPQWGWNAEANAAQASANDNFVAVGTGGDPDGVRLNLDGAAWFGPLFNIVAATAYEYALVLGGYDVNGVPWHTGETPASYLYGASLFLKGGTLLTWTLLGRVSAINTATLYVSVGFYNTAGTLDDLRVPDVDLKAVLQPLVKDTFTDTNGVSLDAHDPEVGNDWAEELGAWEIQANEAQPVGARPAAPRFIAVCDSGESDIFLRCTITVDGAVPGGPVLRYDNTPEFWYVDVNPVTGNFGLYEYVGGGFVLRDNAAAGIGAGTYEVTVVADGQDITCWLDGDDLITWGAAALNETETDHGIRTDNLVPSFDNFHVHALRSPDYEHEFDAV